MTTLYDLLIFKSSANQFPSLNLKKKEKKMVVVVGRKIEFRERKGTRK